MYQNIFALDEVSFKERKKTDEDYPAYALNNYNYYESMLEKDFYLRVFIKKSLFDIDILELDDFLFFQYENTENQEKFLKILELKIIPTFDKIINNANFSLEGGRYFNQTELEDGFAETEGVIKNKNYEFSVFYHKTVADNLSEDLKQRKTIILSFIKKISELGNITTHKQLRWSGKPAHLAFIISQLAAEGYIDAPLKNDNEINYTEFSRIILESFSFQKNPSIDTLRRYLNSDDEKHISLKNNFDNFGFHLPNSRLLG